MRRDAGADRRDSLLPAHASADGAARAARLGRRADAAVGGRDDCRAPTTLLADSRGGGRGGFMPWALLVAGSAASLAANVAVAEPTMTGRVIAAWPSFSLIAAYELLMRQVRCAAETAGSRPRPRRPPGLSAAGVAASAGEPVT